MLQRAATLCTIMALLLAVGCAKRPVTAGGVPVDDPVAVDAANAIANTETVLATTGELLLAARSQFSDARWDQIADTSAAAQDALFLARDALRGYLASGDVDSLTKAINVLTVIAQRYADYQTEAAP